MNGRTFGSRVGAALAMSRDWFAMHRRGWKWDGTMNLRDGVVNRWVRRNVVLTTGRNGACLRREVTP